MRADQRRDAKPQCSDVLPPATGRPPRERNTRPVALPSRAAADLRVEDAPSAASGIRPVTACHVRLSLSSVCVDVTATVQVSAGHQPVLGKSAPGGKGGEAVAKGWRRGGEGVAAVQLPRALSQHTEQAMKEPALVRQSAPYA